MICPNCQNENVNSAKFCARCGTPFIQQPQQPEQPQQNNYQNQPDQPTPTSQPVSTPQPPSTPQPVSAPAPEVMTTNQPLTPSGQPNLVDSSMPNFLALMLSIVLKPATTLEEEAPRLGAFKNAGIITAISTVILTVASLITTMLSLVYRKSCNFFTDKCKTSWEWSNLKDLSYFKIIGRSLLTYAIAMAFVSAVFFGVSRIFKQKQTNYCRMLSTVALAIIPVAVISLLSSPLGVISPTIGLPITLVAALYSLYIFYEGINAEVGLQGDKKIYYNLTSVLVIFVICYIVMRVLLDDLIPASSGLDTTDILDFLN